MLDRGERVVVQPVEDVLRRQPRERVPAVRRARNVDVVEDAAVHACRSRGGQQVVSRQYTLGGGRGDVLSQHYMY